MIEIIIIMIIKIIYSCMDMAILGQNALRDYITFDRIKIWYQTSDSSYLLDTTIYRYAKKLPSCDFKNTVCHGSTIY